MNPISTSNTSIRSLQPCFEGHVLIKNGSTELFKRTFSSYQEAKVFVDQYGKSIPARVSAVELLVPKRTDNIKNFANDLFIPLTSTLDKEDHLIFKIMAIVLDILTFIPRLVTAPLRIVYNGLFTQFSHPLIELIKKHPNFSETIESGYVQMQMMIKESEISKNGKMIVQSNFSDIRNLLIKWFPKQPSYILRDDNHDFKVQKQFSPVVQVNATASTSKTNQNVMAEVIGIILFTDNEKDNVSENEKKSDEDRKIFEELSIDPEIESQYKNYKICRKQDQFNAIKIVLNHLKSKNHQSPVVILQLEEIRNVQELEELYQKQLKQVINWSWKEEIPLFLYSDFDLYRCRISRRLMRNAAKLHVNENEYFCCDRDEFLMWRQQNPGILPRGWPAGASYGPENENSLIEDTDMQKQINMRLEALVKKFSKQLYTQ